jgi:hypothetical protein
MSLNRWLLEAWTIFAWSGIPVDHWVSSMFPDIRVLAVEGQLNAIPSDPATTAKAEMSTQNDVTRD